jgi:hypothetical protein
MKTLGFVAALAVATLIIWLSAAHALAGKQPVVGDVEWPGGGRLSEFPRQFPNVEENESATRLLATAARLPDISAFRTLRAEIISNPPPIWARQIDDILEPPTPPLILHMRLFAMFASDAEERHDCGEDAIAWSDLHTMWILARSLWERPEMMSVGVAMRGTRTILSVASKFPAPRPSWWREIATFNVRRSFIRALEYDAWMSHQHADRYPAGEPDDSRLLDVVRGAVAPFLRPIREIQANESVSRDRQLADALMRHIRSPRLERVEHLEAQRARLAR